MKTLKLSILLVIAIFYSCSSDSIKQKINKTGDVAGQALGEFASGVSSGVEKAVQPKIEIGDNLKAAGIAFGKMTLSSDTSSNENVLLAYIIFNAKYQGSIMAKVFDNKSLEMGRAKINIAGDKDDAKFFEFHFDKRTDIDNDSRIVIE
jgi:hypothetical protein